MDNAGAAGVSTAAAGRVGVVEIESTLYEDSFTQQDDDDDESVEVP